MGVNFSTFEIGRRALRASQFGLTVAGQNIANVNTPGYTRQSVQLSTNANGGFDSRFTGAGVTIDGVRSFRDRFLESRLQTETALAGRLSARRDALSPVDAAFNETSAPGIQSALNNFFGAFRDLEAHPASVPVRAVVVEKGSALAASFRTTRARLVEIQHGTDGAVRDTVKVVNALAREVAELNGKIAGAEKTGGDTSALRDQRGAAVRQLAELTGARSVENSSGMVTLTLGEGRPLVLDDKASRIETIETQPDGFVTLSLDGAPVEVNEGRLRGLLDAIKETGQQISALDGLAASIVERVNTLHASGTDLDGNTGLNFFAGPAGGAPFTAANLEVNAALKANSRLVVASQLANPGAAATIAGEIANLLTTSSIQVGSHTGSFSSVYASIVADAGAGAQSAEDALATQQAILAQTVAQRESFSGVSLDEEAINLLQYQKAYEAAARFLKIADEMTQTIISLGS